MSKTRMVRISQELDIQLDQMAKMLSAQMGRPVSKTDVSKIVAANVVPPVIIKKRRKSNLVVRGSLMWI